MTEFAHRGFTVLQDKVFSVHLDGLNLNLFLVFTILVLLLVTVFVVLTVSLGDDLLSRSNLRWGKG